MVEHMPFKHEAVGSSPTTCTILDGVLMLTLDYTHTLLKALGYHNTDLPFPESVHLTVCTAYINAGLALAYLGYPLNGGVTYLDLGCGFSLLRSLLPDNVHYIGVDKISVDTEKLMRNNVIDDMVSYLKTLDFDANFVLSTGAMLGMGLDEFREFQSLILAKAKPDRAILLGTLACGPIQEDYVVHDPKYDSRIVDSYHHIPFMDSPIHRRGVLFTKR